MIKKTPAYKVNLIHKLYQKGLTQRQIAKSNHMSVKTVNKYLREPRFQSIKDKNLKKKLPQLVIGRKIGKLNRIKAKRKHKIEALNKKKQIKKTRKRGMMKMADYNTHKNPYNDPDLAKKLEQENAQKKNNDNSQQAQVNKEQSDPRIDQATMAQLNTMDIDSLTYRQMSKLVNDKDYTHRIFVRDHSTQLSVHFDDLLRDKAARERGYQNGSYRNSGVLGFLRRLFNRL